MPLNTTGPNMTLLDNHFRSVEGISATDVAQIVADAAAVFSRCLPASSRGVTKGLIYGNIQSGKTAVILALIAIAADNGYHRFVVLTSDLNDLYTQTLDRTKNSLQRLTVLGKADIKALARAQTTGNPAIVPTALVASKNVRVLQGATPIIGSWVGQNVLMIDDEADQASLDTKINDPVSNPSGVNAAVSALRAACPALAFVQTTATPQALLLQDANSPFRPDFVQVTTPGTGYCGGDTFFINGRANLRVVPLLDVVNLRANQVLPPSMQTAICGFLVSAAVLRLQYGAKNYQALIHTSLSRGEHGLVWQLVDNYTRQITAVTALAASGAASGVGAVTGAAPQYPIVQTMQDAYDDLVGPGGTVTFQQVIQEVALGLPSTETVQINSTTGQGVQPNPNRRHVIYVGGAKLGRGVTIKNLLMTYYARDAQQPQVDTVLQHARMYGYRLRELPLTRIHLPDHLADRFEAIHKADNSMRDVARRTGQVIPVIPISTQGLRATRLNVLRRTSVELTTYIEGRQYYPLVPISLGTALQAQTASLDAQLGSICPQDQTPYDTRITDLVTLLSGVFSVPDAPGAWDDELVLRAMELLEKNVAQYNNRAQLVVGNRASAVSKLATRSSIPQIQALLPANAGNPPYGSRSDVPVLVFVRLTGLVANGWDGVPFWVPNVRFPSGNYAFSLNRT